MARYSLPLERLYYFISFYFGAEFTPDITQGLLLPLLSGITHDRAEEILGEGGLSEIRSKQNACKATALLAILFIQLVISFFERHPINNWQKETRREFLIL